MDNWFTSFPLAEQFANKKTTIVGTLKGNSRCLPPSAKSTDNRIRGSSQHFYSDVATICSFWDKGTKPVNLLSTMHGTQRNLASKEDGKSEIVDFYNSTKSGVDTLDKVVRGYSSKRKYSRWPCHVFFTLCDCAVYFAYNMMKSTSVSCTESHYEFKRNLAYELAMPFVKQRMIIPGLKFSVKSAISAVGLQFEKPRPQSTVRGGQGRCHLCSRNRDRKSRTRCSNCDRYVCPEHSLLHCFDCSDEINLP